MRLSVSLRAVAALGVAVGVARPAAAGNNDLSLLNLCNQVPPAAGMLNGQVPECAWVQRSGGLITRVAVPADAQAAFRSLMSELGVVMAPRLLVPAATLGFAGFEFSGEVGLTQINNGERYWDGVETVSPQNTAVSRPNAWLTTTGAFVRKGLWLGLPAFEVGAGVVNVLDSHLLSWQAYAKVALHEGYTRLPLPSLAARAGFAYLTGTDQVRMTVRSLEVIASKGFGVGGTFRMEPFLAAGLLDITATSGVIDATPSCDAYAVERARPGDALGVSCSDKQAGMPNDRRAYFSFPEQDPIRRVRYTGGAKVKFASVFLTMQYDLVPGGDSQDAKAGGAKDGSGQQTSFSFSGGFDF
jgi:hypothetical protein